MMKTRCPICERELMAEEPSRLPDFPFCGPRCRLIDLGRWLGEKYTVPADDAKAPADPDS